MAILVGLSAPFPGADLSSISASGGTAVNDGLALARSPPLAARSVVEGRSAQGDTVEGSAGAAGWRERRRAREVHNLSHGEQHRDLQLRLRIAAGYDTALARLKPSIIEVFGSPTSVLIMRK